jgi:hypothetical protein
MEMSTECDDSHEKIVDSLRRRNSTWRLHARILRTAHVLLGVCATVLAVAAGVVIERDGGKAYGQWFAFTAAAASAVLAFFSIESKGNQMRNAERLLTAALFRYRISGKEKKDLEALVAAYEEGERVIGDVRATPG